jgi:two-component system, chemotaxis family, protein-glutamate methylesterase/glutaminase
MAEHDLVVMGASAGGLEALTTIVGRLSPSLGACVLIVMHTHRTDSMGLLPNILGRSSQLPVSLARDRMAIEPGRVLVAVPDFHLLVYPNLLRVTHGPRENGFRPAIDPVFRTAALAYGPRLIGVVLSGALDDGTHGLAVVKQEGGLAIVQDPGEATIPSMPESAITHVEIDRVLPAAGIAEFLNRTCKPSIEGGPLMADSGVPDEEVQVAGRVVDVAEMEALHGPPSALTCPDCGGALWEIDDGRVTRYKCHVGHQYSPHSLLAEQSDSVEAALWTAVRALEEQAELRSRLATRAQSGGMSLVSQGFRDRAEDSHQQARLIRRVLFERDERTPQPAGAANMTPRRRRKKRATAR